MSFKSQFIAAEDAFAEYDLAKDIYVCSFDKFQTDGPNRLILTFYYHTDPHAEFDDDIPSKSATFCVNFKPETNKIAEEYINW
tara:strand:- start:1737 stop:1985 length:249 start_codon:yes stop_codon:yes gene_type:complete